MRDQEQDRAAHGEFTGEVKPVLYVSDVDASSAFFRDTLGFALLDTAEQDGRIYYAEMGAGTQKFGLHDPTSDAEASRVGKQRLYFRVGDLDAHRRRVEAWGAEPAPIVDTAWMRMFAVCDPDGHEIVFAMTDPAIHTVDPW